MSSNIKSYRPFLLPSFCWRAVELLSKPMTEKLPSDVEGLQSSFARLESVIAQTAEYVDDVVVRPSPGGFRVQGIQQRFLGRR